MNWNLKWDQRLISRTLRSSTLTVSWLKNSLIFTPESFFHRKPIIKYSVFLKWFVFFSRMLSNHGKYSFVSGKYRILHLFEVNRNANCTEYVHVCTLTVPVYMYMHLKWTVYFESLLYTLGLWYVGTSILGTRYTDMNAYKAPGTFLEFYWVKGFWYAYNCIDKMFLNKIYNISLFCEE